MDVKINDEQFSQAIGKAILEHAIIAKGLVAHYQQKARERH